MLYKETNRSEKVRGRKQDRDPSSIAGREEMCDEKSATYHTCDTSHQAGIFAAANYLQSLIESMINCEFVFTDGYSALWIDVSCIK